MSPLSVDPDLLAAGRVRVQARGPVVQVVLDRPEARNAQTPATWQALAAIGEALPKQVRVVVLQASGESFSAGLDRSMLVAEGLPGEPSLLDIAALPPSGLNAALAGFQEAFTWWRRPELVTIAAVQGHAVGAGFQLALACDLRLVSDDAQFAMREASLGLVPDLTGTAPLVRAVGYSRALEICVTGRWVPAEEAVRIGLASLAVPRADLPAACADLVAALLAPDRDAVRETKALLLGVSDRGERLQYAAERAAQVRLLTALAERRAVQEQQHQDQQHRDRSEFEEDREASEPSPR
jgi:enoyl-CoA hydratase/carnithine racemase